MEIVKAEINDLTTVLDLIDQARNKMRSDGNTTQWPEGYPSAETIKRDIRNGFSHICMENYRPVAAFTLMPGPDETYSQITDGQWIDDKHEYYVIHRIASNGQCRGVFSKIMEYSKSVSNNIRVDTHRANSIMRHCLQTNGFTYCGIIHVTDGTERLAFQYIEKGL